ncbi:MAG: hypothetical protein LUD81_01540, partial [Clostridiales bacterium]|nr:hypothetical protein [Clostridiales bacterium]
MFDYAAGLLTGAEHMAGQPVCMAMSVKQDWFAAYYRKNLQSVVIIFRLSTGERTAYFRSDPIYRLEACKPVFYAADNGKKLVLVSQGKRHILDMTALFNKTEKKRAGSVRLWKKETARNGPNSSHILPPEVFKSLRTVYTEKMKRWLPTEKREIFIMRYLRLLFGNKYSCISDKTQWALDRLGSLPVFAESENRYWLIDEDHSMVHVCDSQGRWLCHYQAEQPFFAADVIGDTLYLLNKDTLKLREFKLRYTNSCSESIHSEKIEKEAFAEIPTAAKPFAALAAKLSLVFVIILLALISGLSQQTGYIFVRFQSSEESGVETEDMSFCAVNSDDLEAYTADYDPEGAKTLIRVPAGNYDFYVTYDGYALYYDSFEVKNKTYDANADISQVVCRLVRFDFYDEYGNKVCPKEVYISSDNGDSWTTPLEINENSCFTYEENTASELNYLIYADSWAPARLSVNIDGCRTAAAKVVLSEFDTEEIQYSIVEANPNRYFILCFLNDDEVVSKSAVSVKMLNNEGEETEAVSYEGTALNIFEANEGCYKITVTCEGYEPAERLCKIDPDTGLYVLYMKL